MLRADRHASPIEGEAQAIPEVLHRHRLRASVHPACPRLHRSHQGLLLERQRRGEARLPLQRLPRQIGRRLLRLLHTQGDEDGRDAGRARCRRLHEGTRRRLHRRRAGHRGERPRLRGRNDEIEEPPVDQVGVHRRAAVSMREQVVEILDKAKEEIQARMEQEDINASGRSSRSWRVEEYANGVRLVYGNPDTAPLETLEIGRPGGDVPGGFRMTKDGVRDVSNTFKAILVQWAKDKGIQDFGWGHATMLGRRIAEQGTLRHQRPVDVYTSIVMDAAEKLDAKGVANQLAQVNEQIAAVKAQNAALKKEVKDGTKTWKDVSGQLAVNEQRLKTLTATQKALTNQFNAQVGTNKRLGDSLKEMGAELTALKNEYRSLSASERESAKGQELLQHIQDLDAKMKEADGTMGDFQRNVGNYPDAMKPVTAQLREMTQELIRLRMEGKENTEEYNDLLMATGKMKDAMSDAQREVKQMASDTSALNSVLGAAQAAAGGFSVALGVMNLVGDKDSETAKELAEAQRKLQAAIAITTGLQAVQNALQKESALMMGVNRVRLLAAAAAQRVYAAATRDAEAAQAVFNKVAKSNVYVWLAGIILTVVGAIAAFTRGSKEQEEQTEKVNFQLKKQIDYLNELSNKYKELQDRAITEAEMRLESAKALGIATDEIRKREDALMDARQKSIDQEKERLGYNVREHRKMARDYEVLLENYEANVKRMEEAAGTVPASVTAVWQETIDKQKQALENSKKLLDLWDDVAVRDKTLQSERLRLAIQRKKEDEEERKRQQEAAKASWERWKQEVTAIREANKTLFGHLDTITTTTMSEQEYAKAVEYTAEAMQKLADKLDSANKKLKEAQEIMQAMGDLDDVMERLERQSNPLYNFSQEYKENAQIIMETSAALESSFSSVASMYKTMAQDESKSEEERAKAARKAKAWSKIQIATNAGAAVAKGVATAVDVGFPAAIPAIATMTATILSAIAQAKSLLNEAYESGGVIGGYHGVSMGHDNTAIIARRGEMVLNANQQKQLFEIANGGSKAGGMYSALADALRSMPAPVLVYSEFKDFTNKVATLDEAAKLR
ncbi:hypothetical protein OSTOST_06411 [Ostertagia ostertagi]